MLSFAVSVGALMALHFSPSAAAPVAQAGCDLSGVTLELPQAALDTGMSVPTEGLEFVALGRGVQNYTCADGIYGTNMAVATLFDASCSAGTAEFGDVQTQEALAQPNPTSSGDKCTSFLGLTKLGSHYFQKLTPDATSASPTFDFRSGESGDYVAVSKEFASADDDDANVAWLQLAAVDGAGGLAKSVYRTHTAGGVSPESCTEEGEVLTVEYAAYYWFYNA